MPRVHGLETTQRRRHDSPLPPPPSSSSSSTGAGKFSLSTPFTNFAGRAMNSTNATATTDDTIHRPSCSTEMLANDDDESSFRGTEPSQQEEEEVPGTQNVNFPTSASRRMAHQPDDSFAMISTAAARGGAGSGSSAMMAHQQAHADFAAHYYSSLVSNRDDCRGTLNSSSRGSGIAMENNTPRDKSHPFHTMDLGKSTSSSSSFLSGSKNNIRRASDDEATSNAADATIVGASYQHSDTRISSTNRQHLPPAKRGALKRTANFKDGMDDDDSSSSSGDDDDEEQSVDLLNDASNSNNNNKKNVDGLVSSKSHNQNHPNNNNNKASSMSPSPISPATQTLDRLSLIGSQDGGAELCVHLSANAVNRGVGGSGSTTTPVRVGDGRRAFFDEEVTTAAAASAEVEKACTTATSSNAPMRDGNERRVFVAAALADKEATIATATAAAAVSTKNNNDDGRKDDTTPSNSAEAAALQASTTTTSTTTLDVMKGIEPGVDFLPGATLFAKYKGGCLARAQMIQKRGRGGDLEYYIQYIGLDDDKMDDACWVSVDQLYEINPHTTRLFRQYGVGEGGAKSLESKSDLNGRDHQQRHHGEGSTTSTATLTKQQCIRSLKEYFMSTQNSAVYAQNKYEKSSGGMELPLVTFCHTCNNRNNSLSQVPHHSLCPKHEDFFVSGSYEILNLIVDGNLLGCTACMHHFRNGRPNKQLDHLENCKRYKPKGGRVGKKGQKAVGGSSSGRSVGGMSFTQFSQCDGTGANRGCAADQAGPNQGDNNLDSRGSDGRQDSPELSDYEKLRLRNIQRNEARLAALGLLAPSSKKPASTKKSNKEGFLSRSDSKNDGEAKKTKSKGKTKQPEAQKRTQPKRQKQKMGDEDRSQSRPASANKENSGISNQKQRYDGGVRKDGGDTVAPAVKAKGKSIESKSSLVVAAKSGCRKCTLEWQTDTKDPTKNHDSCCPRANSSRLTNTQQQQIKGSKKSSRSLPLPNISPVVQKKKASQVTPRLLPAVHQGDRQIDADAPPIMTDSSISQADQSMAIDVDSNLFQYALQKGFSTAFLRGKTEEELLALLSSSRESQPSVQGIIPSFIRDFIAEADRNNEIPGPRGTKWLSCPNPWGKIGHDEGDFVVISPFQSESTADMVSVFHQCPNGNIPKRFVANPLEEGSPYHGTHRSPSRKGYSVLRLTRDRMGLRPWGFTVRLHEFGGACLVDSIEPLSPAEAAEDISGWTNRGAAVGLQLHDMIICVNGNSVGCMTEAELQLDLDLCGSEMMLVVARFDIEGNSNQDVTLEDLAMEWNDIGAGAPSRKKVVCFEEQESPDYRCDLNTQSKATELTITSIQNHFESHGGDDDDAPNAEESENGDDAYFQVRNEIRDDDASNAEEGENGDDASFLVRNEIRDDDASNAEESENDDDGPDGSEDTSSSNRNWGQKHTSELESKSDEELMRQLVDTVESGNWNKVKDSILSKILAKRGFLAAAKDESFQRLSCSSGGVARDQVIEWMSRSETFHHYEQIMRAKWSEASFEKNIDGALKDVGYARIRVGGGGRGVSRWALPEEILSRELQCQNTMSKSSRALESSKENSDNRKQGRRKEDADVSELEIKTDEELMEMLREGVKSEEWTKTFEFSRLARVLAKRACLAAARDKSIQQIHAASGGATKDQIIDWIDKSETFHGYKEALLTKLTEKSYENKIYNGLASARYARFGSSSNTRWALPEDIVPRVDSGKQKGIKYADCTTGKRKRESDTFTKQKKQFNLYSDESSQSSSEEENEEEEDDNPWLGCVCGRTHPPPIQVFWIQCEACDSWHNVAKDCVGFSKEAADTIDEWVCWSCSPPCVGLNL